MRTHEILELVAGTFPDRRLISDDRGDMTTGKLMAAATTLGEAVGASSATHLVFIGENSRAVQIALFAASVAGLAFAPLNYRLTDDRLAAVLARTAPAIAVVDESMAERVRSLAVDGVTVVVSEQLESESLPATIASTEGGAEPSDEASDTAVLLFTSGTTGEPKAAVLTHENLTSYVLTTVEFAAAAEDDAALVSVPPYHIAGVSAVLSAAFSGRRSVYLRAFEPGAWVDTIHQHDVTQAMVVPTMMQRVLNELETRDHVLPSLRSLAYGGGPMPRPIIERALATLPHVGFVNAYGLTETASTISVLGPDDHRDAIASDDPAIIRRLGSVGQPLPTVDLTIRDELGAEVSAGERGEVWVRGEQVSGNYVGVDQDPNDGWFRTRDSGELDADGYLYLFGRLDDVIVRGGENLSPGEIEAVLNEHPSVDACAVVGLPDEEWGECVAAAVVPARDAVIDVVALKDHVRAALRSTQTPEKISIRAELPANETGKILRRVLRDELAAEFG